MKRATFPTLYEKIGSDLQRLTVRHHGVLWMLYYSLAIPSFRAVLLFRLANACCAKGSMGKHLAQFLSQLNLLLHPCDFHPQATVGTGIFFPHPLGLVIGRRVCIGDNGTLYHNVTIRQGYAGAKSEPTNADYPSLGGNVVIAAGANVPGKVHIGNNAIVGANVVVLVEVPDNATVLCVPPRILTNFSGINE